MAFTGDLAFTQEYSSTLFTLAQQKNARFKPYVRVETVSSAEAAYFPTIAPSDDPVQSTTRHPTTTFTEVEINNRKVIPTPWKASHCVDEDDINRMKINMQSGYMEADVYSFNRKTDTIIRDAALGVAYIGKNGASSISDLYLESQTINCGDGLNYPCTPNAIGTAPTIGTYPCGLTLAKMRGMMQIYRDADVDEDLPLYWAVAHSDVAYMLGLTQVGSADYNTVKTLVDGKVDTFMGFKFIASNRLLKSAAATSWRTFSWAEGGIVLAYIGDMKTKMAEDPNHEFNTVIHSKMDLGAVRMEGARVHECWTRIGADSTSA